MGRKIKGRKHRGIRDPEKQRQTKLLSIQNKINQAPSNPDDQHIPKSLIRLINLKEQVQNGSIDAKKKRKGKKKLGPVTSHPYGFSHNGLDKEVPFFQQEHGETDRHFKWRINQICKDTINEAAFADKYRVDLNRNPATGQVESVTKRKKDELEVYLKEVKKEQKLKGKKKVKKGTPDESELTKSQKRRMKLKQKKESKTELNKDEFKVFQDNVRFGEIVHEPPTLSAPKKITIEETPRPGKKDLLLKSLIKTDKKSDGPRIKKRDKLTKVANRIIDRKGKRKDMPHALRRKIEKQQQEVVEAYKALKAKRYSSK